MDVSKIIKLCVLLAVSTFTTQARAASFSFDCITNSSAVNCGIAEAQMKLDVTDAGSNQILFEFSNNDIGLGTDYSAIIGEVYFYDGLYLGTPPAIINGSGVDFVNGATPAALPGYNYTPLSVFAAADVTQNTADGVAVNDGTLGIRFDLINNADYDMVIAAMYSGDLVVGIHAKSLGTDSGSESLINSTVVPVPAAAWLFGSGILALAGIARRRSK